MLVSAALGEQQPIGMRREGGTDQVGETTNARGMSRAVYVMVVSASTILKN